MPGVPFAADGGRARWLAILLAVLALGQFANLAFAPTLRPEHGSPNHWDFHVYRAAAEVSAEGGDPLDLDRVRAHGAVLPYNYSPAFSHATSWFFLGDLRTAEWRFVTAKLLAIVLAWGVLVFGLGLKGIWRPLSAFLIVFGFGSALLVDLSAGNITAFEFLLVSVLAVASVRRWDAAFLVALALLCLGKPIWGIFALAPLALYADRRSLRASLLGMVAFALPLVASFAISPDGTRAYLGLAFKFRESGYNNPCVREFISFLAQKGHLSETVATGFWLATALGCGLLAVRARLKAGSDGLAVGAALFLLLPVLLPRFKPYSFALLVPFLIIALTHGRLDARRAAIVGLLSTAPFLVRVDLPFFVLATTPLLPAALGGFPLYFTLGTLAALLVGRGSLTSRLKNETRAAS